MGMLQWPEYEAKKPVAALPALPTEAAIQAALPAMLRAPQPACPVYHRFGPGIYIREVNMPAGIYAVGHYQRFEHTNVFLKGKVRMIEPDGSTRDLTAPMIFTGKPGRKVGIVLEDVVWLNIYATTETDIETLEETFLDRGDAFLSHRQEVLETEHALRQVDRDDYAQMLVDTGRTQALADAQTNNPDDQMPMPCACKIVRAVSAIEGYGMVATAEIAAGELIAPALLDGRRTPAGRYTNHAKHPNAEPRVMGGDIYFVATRNIQGCAGGQLGEEVTVDYRAAYAAASELARGRLCLV